MPTISIASNLFCKFSYKIFLTLKFDLFFSFSCTKKVLLFYVSIHILLFWKWKRNSFTIHFNTGLSFTIIIYNLSMNCNLLECFDLSDCWRTLASISNWIMEFFWSKFTHTKNSTEPSGICFSDIESIKSRFFFSRLGHQTIDSDARSLKHYLFKKVLYRISQESTWFHTYVINRYMTASSSL